MGPRVRYARVAVAPILPSDANVASFGLVIDRVRLVVVRPAADTLADTTVVLPPDSAELDLNLRVPLFSAAETLQVSIIALSGSIPLFAGSAPVEVRTGGGPVTPTTIPVLTYVGPGAGVDSIAVTPSAPFIYLSDSLRFQVEAFQAGVPVPQVYVAWRTSDSTLARISSDGTLRAPASRASVRVIARTPGGGAADSTTVTFVPLPTQLVTVAGAGQSGTVGQPLATQLEVEVRAADNLPVGGVAVRFRSLSGGTPADTIVTSDASGRARVTGVLGTTLGPQTFEANLPAFAGVPVVTFGATANAGPISAATSVIAVSTGTIGSGAGVTVTLRGKDAAGNTVTVGGATVVFTASGGTSTGTIGATTDNGDGTYTATFTGVFAGTATTIGATVNGVPVTTAQPTISVTPGAISANTSVVTVSTGTVASGATTAMTLQAKDAAGNNLTTGGATVVFTLSGGTSTGTIGATTDNGNGTYSATFTGVLAGTGTTVSATVNDTALGTPLPTITVTPGAISAATSVVTVSSGTVVSGGAATLTLQGKDAAGNALATGGATVVFSSSGGTSTGTIGVSTDNGNGTYTAPFTGVTAGTTTTIGATVNAISVSTPLPTITVTPGAISAAMSVVTVSSGTVVSGSTVTLTLQGKDAAGNALATGGATVVFSFSGGTSTGTIGVTTDHGNGTYTATFTGITAGTATTIGATVNGTAVAPALPTMSVTPGTISAATSIVSTSAGTLASGASVMLTLQAKDVAGNNLTTGGDTVAFSFTGGTSTGTITATSDNANGTYTATFTGVAAGSATTLGATINGTLASSSVSLTVVPGNSAAAQSVITVSGGTVASGSLVTLTLQAKDASGNLVPTGGSTVIFSSSGGTSTGAIAPSPATDNGDGTYTATFTGIVAGTATTIGATLDGATVTSTLPAITVTPGPISAAASVVTVSSATVVSGAAVVLSLQGKDAAGNSLTSGGAAVVFSQSGGTSTGTIGATTDNGDGTYAATFSGVGAGTATTIGATIDGTAVTTPLPAITVTPGAIATVIVTPASDTLHALGLTRSFSAEARDANGNLVGDTFTWASSTPAVATVNASGLATALGNGSATITATSLASGALGTASLTVAQTVTAVQVLPPADTLRALGNSRLFAAVAKDASDSVVAGATFIWSSSDTLIAPVNTSGTATALGNGTAIITATAASNGTTGTATLVVAQVVASVVVTPDTVAFAAPGLTRQLAAQARDSNAVVVSGKTFVWASTNPTVATVDTAGLATAVAVGVDTITATADGVTGFAVVTVFNATHATDITANETWAAATSPHIVSGYLKIVNGATLTIEDGATVKFDAGAGLQVGDTALGQAGGLAMLGTPGSIRLTANTATPVPGSWTGIEVQKALAPILWRNVDIEYAGGPRSNPFNEACILLVDPAAVVELDSLHIRQCVHAGVHHFAGNLHMHRSRIDSVTGSGIHSDFAGVLRLDSTTIRGSGQEGLFVGTSAVDLASAVGNRFVGNALAGVHLLAHQLAGFGRQDSIIGNGFGPGGVGDSIVVDSGTVATNVPAFTIFRQPAPYLVTGFVTIASPAGQEVSLDTGLVMAFDTLAALSIGDFADAAGNTSGVSARVISLGTAASPVVLRNRLGRPGWTGLYIGAQTGTPVVRHLRLVNGGYQAGGAFCSNCQVLVQGGFEPLSANLYIDAPIGSAPIAVDSVVSDSSRFRGIIIKRTPPAGLQLRNSSVTNSSATGLVVLADYNPADTIAGNTFSGNGNPLDIGAGALPALGANDIGPHVSDTLWLRGGTLIASDTLPDYPGSPWYVFRALAIDSGASLTVLPGDTVLFGDSVAFAIGGAMPSALRALGTAASPIVFTSVPGRGPWLGMEFVNLSSSTVQHLIVENAGRSLPCFGDCNPIPVAAVRYVNASGSGLTLDGVTIRQSVTMALLVDSAAASPLAIVNSQFYANPYSPMIQSRNPTLLSIHGSDLYHYNAQIIQTLNANTDSIDATDNWWGDVAGLARGFEFQDSLGRASLWFNAVRFAPMAAAPHFAVGPAAQIVAARDTVLNSGYGLNAVIGDPDSIRARVLDGQGRGVAGYDVQWGASTGFVSFLSSLTDAGGRVGSVWTTSTVAGDQFMQAVGPGLGGSPVNWHVTLEPGPTVSTNWQLIPALTQGTVSGDTAFFTSSNRASAFVSNAVDSFGNRTTPTSGFFFSTVPNSGFQFPPVGQVDSIHGDTVFFRVLVSNPPVYQVHGLYDGGLLQDSLFLSVTAAAAGIRIAQDSAVFTSICPTDPANAFCEQRFWAEVVDSGGAALPPSDSYTFTWSPDPAGLITAARTAGMSQDTVYLTARANGITWVTVDETQQGTLVPSHDSLPIRIQQVTASVTVVPDTISARIGDNLIFDGTPRDQGGTPTADTVHWAEDFAGSLTFLDTTSVFNQATVRLDNTSFGTTNVLAYVNGSLLGFGQIFNPVQGLVPGVGTETNGVLVNAGLVYVATDTGVAMIDQSDRVSTFIPIPEPTYYLAHDRVNNRIYAGSRFSGNVYVIDGFTNTLQRNFLVNPFFVPQMAVDESNGNLLVPTVVCVLQPGPPPQVCIDTDFLGVFDSVGALVDTIPIGDQGVALAFDQATRTAYVGVFAGPVDTIKVVDLAQRKAVDSIQVGSSLANLAFNRVTGLLYASDYVDNNITVIDAATRTVRNVVPVGLTPEGIAIDTIRNKIYIANTADPTIYVIDGTTDQVIQFISVPAPTSQAAVWQGGNQLYVNTYGGRDVRILKF